MSRTDPPTWDTLSIERHPEADVATLTLRRPRRLNALSRQLLGELVEACRWVDGADDVRCLVVTGEGPSFSAGFDLGDFQQVGDGVDPRAGADLGRQATEALTDVDAITVGAARGHCVGGGLVLLAACDIRIVGDDFRGSIPEVDLGIPLAWGGIPRLVRELGPTVTKDLVLSCRPFGADESLALRFVSRIAPSAEVVDAATELAVDLAAKSLFALRTTKQQVNAVLDEIAGTGRNASDADVLMTALHDPESRAVGARYLASKQRSD